ncbi:MAG: J domain-containing protein [Anaerolineae bacterium]|nr:J domain-containing protein [Anaerolineae bacterium]
MGSYRYETAYASAYAVNGLIDHGALDRMLHNGGDIVLFATPQGQRVSLHFIESALPVYEIRKTLEENGAKGIYTLFLLWSDMMLPQDGQVYRADDWMEALYTLYQGSIYAYDQVDTESFLFPVYFRGESQLRRIEYGTTIRFAQLTCREVRTYLPGLNGAWRVADFGGVHGKAHDPQANAVFSAALSEHYVILGVTPEDDRDTIKRAYRLLARRYHPDLNNSPEAHEQMQRVNEAYQAILGARQD